MGNARSQTSVSRNWKETGKKQENMRKHYRSKKSFSYEIYAGTSKAAHKVFRERGASSTREFSVLHNLQFFTWKLWLKKNYRNYGASSNRRNTVNSISLL